MFAFFIYIKEQKRKKKTVFKKFYHMHFNLPEVRQELNIYLNLFSAKAS